MTNLQDTDALVTANRFLDHDARPRLCGHGERFDLSHLLDRSRQGKGRRNVVEPSQIQIQRRGAAIREASPQPATPRDRPNDSLWSRARRGGGSERPPPAQPERRTSNITRRHSKNETPLTSRNASLFRQSETKASIPGTASPSVPFTVKSRSSVPKLTNMLSTRMASGA
jgi:hypothetical protein